MNWTEEKNERRCNLIDKGFDEGLTPEEAIELEQLQHEMLEWRQETYPRPMIEGVVKMNAATDAALEFGSTMMTEHGQKFQEAKDALLVYILKLEEKANAPCVHEIAKRFAEDTTDEY